MPSEHDTTELEVRALVRRVIDGLLDEPVVAQPPPANIATEATVVTRDTADRWSIAIVADHGGFPLKERLAFRLREAGHDVHDCGTDSTESVDYPDLALAVATLVAEGTCTYGIVVDGAGIGWAMAANKVPGVRAALCYDLSTARNSSEHNHANVLTLGAGLIGDGLAWQIVQEWLSTPWGGGRHQRRVDKIDAIAAVHVGTAP